MNKIIWLNYFLEYEKEIKDEFVGVSEFMVFQII